MEDLYVSGLCQYPIRCSGDHATVEENCCVCCSGVGRSLRVQPRCATVILLLSLYGGLLGAIPRLRTGYKLILILDKGPKIIFCIWPKIVHILNVLFGSFVYKHVDQPVCPS